MKIPLTALALLLAIAGAQTPPASAQEVILVGPHGVPVYRSWQASWDRYEFDRRHVILGTVTAFSPYRLQVARRNGTVQTIDLKHGTVILPTGATPTPNQRVAVVGYYSRGTFIANRLVLHD